jgi:predicted lysophospholipase L1 biosynthesis ABC-type transport system permease subunit
VAVVDQAFAAKFFPGESAIGHHFGLLPDHANDYEIVGVVKDTKYRNPASAQDAMFFLPYTQTTAFEPEGYRWLETGTLYAQSLELSVAGAPESYERALRSAMARVNPGLLLIGVKSYSEQEAVQYNQERLVARLTGLFSLVALLLASVGLYGVTSYAVARRSGEIGIRMALGASRARVAGLVLQGTFLQVGIGLSIGTPVAIISARYLASQLYGVARFDPSVLGTAILVLAACAFLAGFLPARRAASIQPSAALRLE